MVTTGYTIDHPYVPNPHGEDWCARYRADSISTTFCTLPAAAHPAPAAAPADRPHHVWVATEFSVNDGGRAWMQAATDIDAAKALCQQRHDDDRARRADLPPEPLNWADDASAKWMFGQDTQAARVGAVDFYEVRKIEVQQ